MSQPIMANRHASKTCGPSNFDSAPFHCTPTKSVPPHAGKPVAYAIFDPHRFPTTARAIFLKRQEAPMLLEHHIEELRAELRECIDAGERREIEVELELARAELEVFRAEIEGRVSAEPPF